MSFDTLAPHYGWMEVLLAGQKLQRCRTAFLDEIPKPRNILLLGEGHGRCLVECCHRFSHASITCMDSSEGMLAEARRQLKRHDILSSRVQLIKADILSWRPTESVYDLVITNFFLDCFTAPQLKVIVTKVAQATTADANWLIADFQVAPGTVRRVRSRIILWLMYSSFRVSTGIAARSLTPPQSLLHSSGFQLRESVRCEWGLLYSSWWQRRPW